MIDHLTFRVKNLEKTKAFYSAALAPCGYVLRFEGEEDGVRALGYGSASGARYDTWFVQGPSSGGGAPYSSGCHIAWSAPTRAAVDAFHAAALAMGGTDNGKPGLRPHYSADYYGAFVIDPDGNNVEAVCRAPA